MSNKICCSWLIILRSNCNNSKFYYLVYSSDGLIGIKFLSIYSLTFWMRQSNGNYFFLFITNYPSTVYLSMCVFIHHYPFLMTRSVPHYFYAGWKN